MLLKLTRSLIDSTRDRNLTWASLDWRRCCKRLKRCRELPFCNHWDCSPWTQIPFYRSFRCCTCLPLVTSCRSSVMAGFFTLFGILNFQVVSSDFKLNHDGILDSAKLWHALFAEEEVRRVVGDPFHEVSVLYQPTIFFLESTCSLLFLSILNTDIQRSATVGLNSVFVQIKGNLTCSIISHGHFLIPQGFTNLTWASLDWREVRSEELSSAIASVLSPWTQFHFIFHLSLDVFVCFQSSSCNFFPDIAEIHLTLSNSTGCGSND